MSLISTANMMTVTSVDNVPAYGIHTSAASAKASIPAHISASDVWTISQELRKPERITYYVNIPRTSQGDLTTVPEQYRGLLVAVLESAAKTILKRFLDSTASVPATIPASLLDADSIMGEAVGNNSEWLNKDDLSAAWEASATRKRMVSDPRYAGGSVVHPYRVAVHAFADLILKLSGKTASYTPDQLDAMLAKLHADDLDTAFGNFVARRVEMLRNKKTAPAIDLDML